MIEGITLPLLLSTGDVMNIQICGITHLHVQTVKTILQLLWLLDSNHSTVDISELHVQGDQDLSTIPCSAQRYTQIQTICDSPPDCSNR